MAPSTAAADALRDAREHAVGNAAATRAAQVLTARLRALAPADLAAAGAMLGAMILARNLPHP